MKTIYQISIYQNSTVASELAVLAARFNGGDRRITLETIKQIFDSNKISYPFSYENYHLSIYDNRLLLERTSGEDDIVCLQLVEVELYELERLTSEN